MSALALDDLKQYSDMLRLPSGLAVTVRFVEPDDAGALQDYFRGLALGSRYNRFLGAANELPPTEIEKSIHVGDHDIFSVIVVTSTNGRETIIGEARYAFDATNARFEFGLSVADRWQGQGLGRALLSNLECRSAAFGAGLLFGDTLRSNGAMIALARRAGYAFEASPGDWRLVRFRKQLDLAPRDIPCASWRVRAAEREFALSSL